MGEPERTSDVCSHKSDSRNDEVSASHFALQIALQTMKERCQLLQQRLSAVEEENLRLRIESQNNTRKNIGNVPASDISKLEEKVTQLSREKSQLIDRITMVAKENNQLWTRLSRVTEANQSLGNHLSKISETLNKHPIGETSKSNELNSTVMDCNSKLCSEEKKEESLEEISLKIIDTIRREKKVLEQQCEEMVELQTGSVSVEECGFTLTANGDIASGVIEEDTDFENVMEDIRKLREKMKEEYKVLKDQQAGLQAAIVSINAFIAEKKMCKCEVLSTKDNNKIKKRAEGKSQDITMSTVTSPLDDIQKQLQEVAEPPVAELETMVAQQEICQESTSDPKENNDPVYNYVDDRICPLCSKFYSHKVPFDEFHCHVLSHFGNEGQEDDSLINNFEVIT